MKPHQYHQVLGALDRSLEIFDQAGPHLSTDDLRLRLHLARLRSAVAKAEAEESFEFELSSLDAARGDSSGDPDVTRVPWAQAFVSDRVQLPPRPAP